MNTVINYSPFAIIVIMLGVGMSVNIKTFIEVFKNFKILLIGLFSQMVILPTIGFLFAFFAPIDNVLKLGIVLITCVPSAVTSNYITKLVGGNIALSVSLTSITSCLSFITIPFILTIIAPMVIGEITLFQKINFMKLSLGLLLISTLPVFLGIFIAAKFSIFVEKIRKFYSIFSFLLLVLIIFTAWFSEWDYIVVLYQSIGLLVLSLAIVVLISSYILTSIFNLDEANKKAIIIESFVQNAAMAIIIGGISLGDKNGYLAISALYALLQYKILLFFWATRSIFTRFNKS